VIKSHFHGLLLGLKAMINAAKVTTIHVLTSTVVLPSRDAILCAVRSLLRIKLMLEAKVRLDLKLKSLKCAVTYPKKGLVVDLTGRNRMSKRSILQSFIILHLRCY
jgi:hypothetical protein